MRLVNARGDGAPGGGAGSRRWCVRVRSGCGVLQGRRDMHEYDKSSKWLIEHHGDSILRLAGVRGIVSWKALQAELVQSRRLPDGLIEAKLRREAKPARFVLEISTYPYRRLSKQAVDASVLVYLARGELPEV